MQRIGNFWGKDALPSWQMSEDLSWPLTVALYIRDVLMLPATAPFFIPPLVTRVPDHIPVSGPELDVVLADEWEGWFLDLLADHLEIPRGGSIGYFSLGDRAPLFADTVGAYFEPAVAAADDAFEAYFKYFQANIRTQGSAMTKLVRSIEKELGRKAAPFDLGIKILPVDGFWLHRTGLSQVLMSEAAHRDPHHLRRLLGPVITELA